MPSKDEKRRRRALTRALAEQERANDEAGLPFPKAVLEQLIEHVADAVLVGGGRSTCDHMSRHTQRFLDERSPITSAAGSIAVCEGRVAHPGGLWCQLEAQVRQTKARSMATGTTEQLALVHMPVLQRQTSGRAFAAELVVRWADRERY
jgi:hypothetical protein